MISLIKRNLLYTIRDRTAFAMSFLAVIILIVLYKAFLGNFQIEAIKASSGLKTINVNGIEMVNYWLIAGLTLVTSVTSTISGLGVVVSDRETGKLNDFKLSGISPNKIVSSYYLSAVILGFFITMVSFILGIVIFVGFHGLTSFSAISWLAMVGLILLGNIVAVLFSMPAILFIKTRSGFSTFSTLIGTLIGFVSGLYIAIGSVGVAIKNMMLSLPFIHEISLFKHFLMKDSENSFFKQFPESAQIYYDKMYGNRLYINDETLIHYDQSFYFVILWIFILFLLNISIHIIVRKKG